MTSLSSTTVVPGANDERNPGGTLKRRFKGNDSGIGHIVPVSIQTAVTDQVPGVTSLPSSVGDYRFVGNIADDQFNLIILGDRGEDCDLFVISAANCQRTLLRG